MEISKVRETYNAEVLVNSAPVWCVYYGTNMRKFFRLEEDAKKYMESECILPAWDLMKIDVGEMFIIKDEGTVYFSNDTSQYLNGVAGTWQMLWMVWVEPT